MTPLAIFFGLRQLGSSGDDYSFGVSADSLGNVYFSGETDGSLGSPNAGGTDAFVAKFSNVPEPGNLMLAVLVCVGLLMPRKQAVTRWRAV